MVIDSTKFKVISFLTASGWFKGFAILDIIRGWSESGKFCLNKVNEIMVWTPEDGHLKVNFDRCSDELIGKAGYGGLIHDAGGDCILKYTGPLGPSKQWKLSLPLQRMVSKI